jgi:uncharacterized protein YjbI with pentapeptide repeats
MASIFDSNEFSVYPPHESEILEWITEGPESWTRNRENWQKPFSLRGVRLTSLKSDAFNDLDLSDFNLEGCDFRRFNFKGTIFRRANASFSRFSHSTLDECDFYEANLSHTDFLSSQLNECRFRKAIANKAIFQDVYSDRSNYSRASFAESNLDGAVFEDCDFSTANFSSANLMHSAFPYSNFDNARMFNADIYSARLGQVKNLTQQQVDLTNGDVETSLPAFVERPAQWFEEELVTDSYERIVASNKQVIAQLTIYRGLLIDETIASTSSSNLEGAYRVLLREAERVRQRGGLSNISPELEGVLKNYFASFDANFGDTDKIVFCAEGEIFKSIFYSVRDDISERDRELSGLLEGIIAVHSVLSSSVKEWVIHHSETFDIDGSVEAVRDFKNLAEEILCVLADNRSQVDNGIIERLEGMKVEVDADRPVHLRVALSFAKDVLLAPLKYFAEFGRKTAEKFQDRGSEELAKTLAGSFKLALGGALLMYAAKYPAIFGPIQKLFELGVSFWK